MNTVVKIDPRNIDAVPFQEASLDIWDKKYRLTAKDDTPIDRTMDDTYQRVARALADVEHEDLREHWNERFVWALRRGAIPAGRIISNAAALEHSPRPRPSTARLGHDPRLDGRHPQESSRGGAHAEGGLWSRL